MSSTHNTNPNQVSIKGDSGLQADVVPTNGSNGLVTISPGHISTDNALYDTLQPDEVYTGTWENIVNFGIISLTVTATADSIIDGLCVCFSMDGIATDSTDSFSIEAGDQKTFSFQAATQYYRIIYTNGGVASDIRMQVKLSPYYIKPSSHRIEDEISGQDDAELMKSVLTAKSDLTNLFENISSYRNTLNVNPAYVHRKIVNETFHQNTGTITNIAVSASREDIVLTVDDSTGFVIGDEIKIEENGLQEIGILTITNVVGNVITLDRPIGNDYTSAAEVVKVLTNMAVLGTLAAPSIFEVDPPPTAIWQVTRYLISLTHAGVPDDGKFGGIAALTNGVALRATTASGITTVFSNWKTNGDMKLDMFNVEYSDKAPAGENGTHGRWTFTTSEIVAELDGDASPVHKMEILIQDDLTGLSTFKIRAQGRVFAP